MLAANSWEVWYLVYLVNGIWFAVSGAAYVADKGYLKWLAVTFYHEVALNLALRYVISGDTRLFGSTPGTFPSFELQSIASLVVFMVFFVRNSELDTYSFLVLFPLPAVVAALFVFSRACTPLNAVISLSVGAGSGFVKAWAYEYIIPHILSHS